MIIRAIDHADVLKGYAWEKGEKEHMTISLLGKSIIRFLVNGHTKDTSLHSKVYLGKKMPISAFLLKWKGLHFNLQDENTLALRGVL